jgi:hypothetical protein
VQNDTFAGPETTQHFNSAGHTQPARLDQSPFDGPIVQHNVHKL